MTLQVWIAETHPQRQSSLRQRVGSAIPPFYRGMPDKVSVTLAIARRLRLGKWSFEASLPPREQESSKFSRLFAESPDLRRLAYSRLHHSVTKFISLDRGYSINNLTLGGKFGNSY